MFTRGTQGVPDQRKSYWIPEGAPTSLTSAAFDKAQAQIRLVSAANQGEP